MHWLDESIAAAAAYVLQKFMRVRVDWALLWKLHAKRMKFSNVCPGVVCCQWFALQVPFQWVPMLHISQLLSLCSQFRLYQSRKKLLHSSFVLRLWPAIGVLKWLSSVVKMAYSRCCTTWATYERERGTATPPPPKNWPWIILIFLSVTTSHTVGLDAEERRGLPPRLVAS